MRSIRRVFKLALLGMWRNIWLTLTSISVMFVVLITVSVFAILGQSFNEAISTLEEKLNFVIYVDTNAEESDVLILRDEIASNSLVRDIEYISKDEAYQEYQNRTLTDDQLDILSDEELSSQIGNPLPYSLVVEPVRATDLQAIYDEYRDHPLVSQIDFNQQTIDRINNGAEVIRFVGIAAILFLIAVSISVILNTMRLAIYNRRQEIEIMKLVGATNWFVQWPFIIEGMYDGILAGVFSTALLYISFEYFSDSLTDLSSLLEVPLFEFGAGEILLAASAQIVLGMLLGGIGSYMAVRRHITV